MENKLLLSGALRRGWWIVVLVGALSAGLAAYLSTRQTPVYEATATLVIGPGSKIKEPRTILRSFDTLERRTVVATIAKIASRQGTRAKAAERMGVALDILRAYWVGAYVLPNTNLIRLAVRGPDPEQAAKMADALGAATRRAARDHFGLFSVRALAPSQPPRHTISPEPQRAALTALLLGVFLGGVIALLLEARRLRRRG